MPGISIGQLARRAGVPIDTVRYYERNGLLAPADRTAAGYRQYGGIELRRLRFIRRAKALGFSLEEIAQLLQLNAARGSRAAVRKLAEQRLADLEQKIRELSAIRDALAHLVRRCSGTGALAGCPIIENVLAQPAGECKEN